MPRNPTNFDDEVNVEQVWMPPVVTQEYVREQISHLARFGVNQGVPVDWTHSISAGEWGDETPLTESDAGTEGLGGVDFDEGPSVNTVRRSQAYAANTQNYSRYLNKKQELKVLIIDKETYEAISTIVTELHNELQEHLDNTIKLYTQLAAYKSYAELVNGETSSIYITANNICIIESDWKTMLSGGVVGRSTYLFKEIANKAFIKYSMEHSKYKYYPRLKKSMQYGNEELLKKIMSVVNIGEGKIICPQ